MSCEHYLHGCFAISDLLRKNEELGKKFMRTYCLNREKSHECQIKATLAREYETVRKIENIAQENGNPWVRLLAGIAAGAFIAMYEELWEEKEEMREKPEYKAMLDEMLKAIESE